MKLNLKGFLCFFIGLLISFSGLLAQTKYESEGDMIKAANEMYEEGQYIEAMPLFSQLVSLYPKDAVYNMKYGVCLMHAERDKTACLKYLKYASGKSEAGPISHYHYALALHRNYELNRAIKYYNKYKSAGNSKELEEFEVARKIEMCENGKSILSNVLDLNVIEKQEISREEFFRIYDLGEIGGKIIVKPDEFKSKLDLKLGGQSLIYLPPDPRVIYISGYGDNKGMGLDIFRVRKSASGAWGSPENIGSPVNTAYDESYPFMHPDGYLYFASKGHNSMGGFDLFKSAFNESTGTWSEPENLNFAISSTYDDILFISDIKNQLAYFASDRSSIDGKIVVYRVQISRKPFDLAFLNGKFISEGETEIKSAKITIYDLEQNVKVGTFFTDKESGEYSIQLPKSGRSYKFVVETDEDSPVHTGKVDIPEQTELASLKQEIRLVGSGDNQKLVIKNLFDPSSKSAVDEASMLALLKSASNLEVNSSVEDLMKEEGKTTSLETVDVNKPVEGESVLTKHKALKVEMASLANQLSSDLKELEIAIAFGYNYSFEKSKTGDEMYDDVENLRLKMENEVNDVEKKNILDELLKLRSKLEPVASDAIVSFDFTESLLNEYGEKKNDQERINKALAEIKAKGENPSPEEMENDLNDFGPKIQDLKEMRSVYEMAPQRYRELISANDENLKRQESYYNDISSDLNSLKDEINRLTEKIDATTNKKARNQLTAEKGAKEIDLEDLTYEYKEVREKYQKLKIEKKSLESDSKQLSAFISAAKSQREELTGLNEDDKAELIKLIDYFKEQRYIEDVIGKEYDAFIASGASDQSLNKAQYYAAVDNSGNSVNYDELYFVNLAGIELIADGVRKNEELSTLYQHWAQTVNEDIKIQKNHLQFTEKNAEKDLIEERIKILERKQVEYEMKSAKYSDEAIALASPIIQVEGDEKPQLNDEEQVQSIDQAEEVIANQTEVDDTKSLSENGEKDTPDVSVNAEEDTQIASATAEKEKQVGVSPVAIGVSAKLAVTAVSIAKDKNSRSEIDEAYENQSAVLNSAATDPSTNLSAAALELNWAKSLVEVRKEKEKELNATESREEKINIQKEINELSSEIKKHVQLASKEFTDFEIEVFLGELIIQPNQEYAINFDPEKVDDDHYNEKYNMLISEVELSYSFSEAQKNRFISEIHNYWSMSIQDEILYLKEKLPSMTDKDEIKAAEEKIKLLQKEKESHITQSNQYLLRFKSTEPRELISSTVDGTNKVESTDEVLQKTDDGLQETDAVERKTDDISELEDKEEPDSYVNLTNSYKESQANATLAISQKEASIGETKGKSEKQQLSLSLLVLQSQKTQNDLAVSDLEKNQNEPFIDEEAEKELADKVVGWQEQAEDYVFSKKDFNASKNLDPVAAFSYAEASTYYQKVQSLEKQKQSLLTSEVVDKTAENQLLEIQKSIDENKLQAYLSLAKSNDQQYLENKRIIDEILKTNPNLQTENPKLWRQIMASDMIYREVGNYQETANGFESTSLKFDVFDQAQFMSEYVLAEQQKILEQLVSENVSGELAFLVATSSNSEAVNSKEIREAQVQDFKITEEELNTILSKDAFVEYEKDLKALEDIEVEQNQINQLLVASDTEIQNKRLESDSFKELAITSKKGKRKKLQKEAEVIDIEILPMQSKRDSLALASVQLEERKRTIQNNSKKLLNTEKEEVKLRMMLLAEVRDLGKPDSLYISKTAVAVVPEKSEDEKAIRIGYTTVLDDKEFVEQAAIVPKKLDGDLFIKASSTTVSPYSEAKPIPVDEEIPEGLVFKVQIGAFRNPIPQDLFKGFAPLMGEKIPNGITRYTAGLFRDFGNANRAKNEIRTLGYDDAFVVGFMDGKRISFQELRNVGDIDLTIPPLTDTGPVGPRSDAPQEVLNTPSIINDEGEVSSAIAEQTVNAKSVIGIFFTVQVGVYSNTILPEKLKTVRELNSELLPNGNIRYSAGQFQNLEQARQRRSEIVNQNIEDAFVTAYKDGIRITVSQATQGAE